MKKAIFFILVALASCKQEKVYHDEVSQTFFQEKEKLKFEADVKAFQSELNEEYRNPEKSPLPEKLRLKFTGHDFFPISIVYNVKAKFTRTPNEKPFLMPTTSNRTTEEVLFGIAEFELNGKAHTLQIYQSPKLKQTKGYEDYLFLPFSDETNGESTYGGGRYLDLRIPQGNEITINFNKAYNPYCAYNEKYSCPLVPKGNMLLTKIEAGVKYQK